MADTIQLLYKSRNFLLEQLQAQNFDTDGYTNFSINEVDAMYNNLQLDMLLENPSNGRKTYVKYYLGAKTCRKENLDKIIEDLYETEGVLKKTDTLLVVQQGEMNDTLAAYIKYLFEHSNIFVVLRSIPSLQFNCLKHVLVPPVRILTDDEVAEMKTKYGITNLKTQLPEISRFDAVALAMCVRPGEVARFDRKSLTAMTSAYFRVCV